MLVVGGSVRRQKESRPTCNLLERVSRHVRVFTLGPNWRQMLLGTQGSKMSAVDRAAAHVLKGVMCLGVTPHIGA